MILFPSPTLGQSQNRGKIRCRYAPREYYLDGHLSVMIHVFGTDMVRHDVTAIGERLTLDPVKPQSANRSCQMDVALRPRASPVSITSRTGSQALVAEGNHGVFAASCDPNPVVTPMAGFASQPVVTVGRLCSLAGFAGVLPQPAGSRKGMPVARR